jgi:hypothetical protein
MKREIVFTIFLAIVTLGFFGCQKDDLSNSGPSTLGVTIQALNKSFSLPVSNSGTKSASATTSFIVWDTTQMVVSNIKFEAKLKSLATHRDSIEISYKWTGPKVTDLLASNITLGNFILQPGFYDEIEIKVQGSKFDAGKKPVFYLRGKYTTSSSNLLPVMVKVNEDITFKTEKDSVTVAEESIDITSSIQLYLDQLMVGLQPSVLDNAVLTGGIIVISAESNREIYRTIMHNLIKDHHCDYQHNNKNKGKKHYD